jgi:hypothetical protein
VCFLFFESRGVWKEEGTDIGCSRRAPNRSAKPIAHETRQEARVIDMGVREDDRVDRRGIDGNFARL